MKTTGNTILLTGGGSGIGLALAQRWHDAGNHVIVTGRNPAKLKAAAAGRANLHAVPLDVADPDAIADFAKEVTDRFPAINVLVNNAGVMMYETIDARRELADAEATVITNLLGPIRLIDALIDHLVTAPDSAIVNITSGLAFVPLPKAPTYSATKAALHSYTQALRVQLEGKVEVIELAPPAVRTELTPGQSTRENYMPLGDFADEVMSLFALEPTPSEILVRNVLPLRNAEAEGAVAERLALLKAL
ncbi:SDR family oxidoreductase [Sphingopyxis sp. 113P3]|jgi:Short-chain dehydrogenase involved in D-alanine esterification of lipoteichoic acid and wall teichoic acid (D-alanine transfer protein)|uniref:SDR family oxidoreductase n=1 Tax=Sphingopyxis sp. (strain 113P3) TaxID=292913 RepID=UPI0006AD0A67|nr:SDR family oxidoreductase [Sphingopyxis sp. 113P3]ALC10864.1 DltE [Sphingopyxis sp. 113P3]